MYIELKPSISLSKSRPNTSALFKELLTVERTWT